MIADLLDARLAGLKRAAALAYAPITIALSYYLGAQAAFYVGTLSDRIFAPFWPPNVVLLCAFLIIPPARWWMIVAASFPAHVIAELGVGMPASQYLVAFATNCAFAVTSALAMRRFVGGPPWFTTLRRASIYVLIAVGLAPAGVAFAGAFVQITGGGELDNYWTYWANWFSANSLAAATLGPVVLSWVGRNERTRALRGGGRKTEAVVLLLGLTCACFITFGAAPSSIASGFLPTLLYLPALFVIWGASRFGAVGASATILVVTIISIWQSLNAVTLFNGDVPEHNVLALQAFLIVLSVPALLLGAAIDELHAARRGMRDLAAAVIRAQDDERRHVSYELHEKIGQELVAAHLITARLDKNAPDANSALEELDDVLRRLMADVRAVSYLLHPPLLDEAGLALALKSYVAGLAKGGDVAVDLALPQHAERLPAEVELVLFRVAEDALASALVQGGSRRAKVGLACPPDNADPTLVVTIEHRKDQTSGASARSAIPSLGLERMRERLRQVGGQLRIDTANNKTILTAMVPLVPRSS